MIYAWAQEHKARVGAYPHMGSGPVVSEETSAVGLKWSSIHISLQNQLDGLPPGLTLRSFIESHHRVYVPLTEKQIVTWAKAHKQKHGSYPQWHYGGIEHRDADGDTWANVNSALCFGLRGLEGGRTLAEFVEQIEKAKNILSPELVLQWADDFRIANGFFPKESSPGTIPGTGFTWRDIDKALMNGQYGLPSRKPRDDLWNFLERNRRAGQLVPAQSPLSIKKIIDFAIAHFKSTGERPHALSGSVIGTYAETWAEIDGTLRNGGRGFAGGESLKSLLDEFYPQDIQSAEEAPSHTGEAVSAEISDTTTFAPRRRGRPRKEPSLMPVLCSAVEAPRRRGRPRKEIEDAPLLAIHKSLPAETKRRGRPRKVDVSPVTTINVQQQTVSSKPTGRYADLTLEKILNWLDAHKQSEGYYPLASSGKIPGADGKNWFGIQNALKEGVPGVEPGISLSKFVKKYRPRTAKHQTVSVDLPSNPVDEVVPEDASASALTTCGTEVKAGNFGGNFVNSAMAAHRERMATSMLAEINEENILRWIDGYFSVKRAYPCISASIADAASGVTWKQVADALEKGNAHLPSGGSLSKFIFEQYGVIGSKVVRTPKHKMFEHQI